MVMSTEPNAQPAPQLDPALDPEAGGVAPEFGGSADAGVVSSVPEHDPMAGDAGGLLQAELRKLYDLFGELVALLDAGELDQVGQRFFGGTSYSSQMASQIVRVGTPASSASAGVRPPRAAKTWSRVTV